MPTRFVRRLMISFSSWRGCWKSPEVWGHSSSMKNRRAKSMKSSRVKPLASLSGDQIALPCSGQSYCQELTGRQKVLVGAPRRIVSHDIPSRGRAELIALLASFHGEAQVSMDVQLSPRLAAIPSASWLLSFTLADRLRHARCLSPGHGERL
jgi:hypothetical protein